MTTQFFETELLVGHSGPFWTISDGFWSSLIDPPDPKILPAKHPYLPVKCLHFEGKSIFLQICTYFFPKNLKKNRLCTYFFPKNLKKNRLFLQKVNTLPANMGALPAKSSDLVDRSRSSKNRRRWSSTIQNDQPEAQFRKSGWPWPLTHPFVL